VIAPGAAIFADHLVKHAAPLAPVDEMQMVKDLRLRGLADAVIVSGRETGAAVDVARMNRVLAAVDAPILIGSGLNAENAAAYGAADGAIVGTAVKREGRVEAPVDLDRVDRLVRAFKQLAGR
jgi:predicted TIM-barrel enzyme